MAYQAIPPTSSGGGNGSGGVAYARAQALLGASNITKLMGDELNTTALYRNAGSSGTITVSSTKKGGSVTLSTTATNNRTAILMPAGSTILIDNAQTSRWYAVARFAATSAVDNVADINFRFSIAAPPGTSQTVIGVLGSVSTGFFSYLLQNAAGAVTASGATTVAIDTATHLFEMWNDLTTVSFAIDGVVVATSAASNVGTSAVAPALWVGNSTTAAARTMDADFYWVCTGDPA